MVKVTAAIWLIQNKEGGGQGARGEHGACQGSSGRKWNIKFNSAGVEGKARGLCTNMRAHAQVLVQKRSEVEEICSHCSVRNTDTHTHTEHTHTHTVSLSVLCSRLTLIVSTSCAALSCFLSGATPTSRRWPRNCDSDTVWWQQWGRWWGAGGRRGEEMRVSHKT